MFITKESGNTKERYINMLKAMASLSRLSSESSVPYLGYREVENIFCKVFGAENLSRSDCSADASKNGIGIGIKTFLEGNGRSWQKIAEFNKDANLFKGKTPNDIVLIISKLRNERINATKRIYGLNDMIYHCVVRQKGEIKVFECSMDLIDIDSIKNIKIGRSNTLTFNDNINEYSINLSKSTLYKRFITKNVILKTKVEIIADPYEIIMNLLIGCNKLTFEPIKEEKAHVFLPLYSETGAKRVQEKSGLNQWNAGGRKRKYNEVYIPIPIFIRKNFQGFFPSRDKAFDLLLPDGKKLNAKICQDGGKALMTNPNTALGEWILRQVMNLNEGEILTYDRLEELGIDSVVIYKEENNTYSIDFAKIGSYDEFKEEI